VFRGALARRRLLDPRSGPWLELRELEDRWERDEFFRKKRDSAAFHVDRDVIDTGLDELSKEDNVELSVGDGRKSVQSHHVLGTLALFNGLKMDLATYGKFAEQVGEDHSVAAEAIQLAFMQAAEAAGIPMGEK
jgi:hypothetical protein